MATSSIGKLIMLDGAVLAPPRTSSNCEGDARFGL
jgi:hypothetical protein